MLQIIVITALCFEAHVTLAADPKLDECLDADKKYAPEAVDCDNQLADAMCEALFVGASPEAKAASGGDETNRPKKCYTDSADPNENYIKAATQVCPKTCGLCCKTAKYDCEDNAKFDCKAVKKDDQCKEPWITQLKLVKNCPHTCGLCDQQNGDCQDSQPNCVKDQCKNTDFLPAMEINCKKTCDFCDEETTALATTAAPATAAPEAPTAATTTIECGNHPSCPAWVSNGFCDNPAYNVSTRAEYCGKLCKLC